MLMYLKKNTLFVQNTFFKILELLILGVVLHSDIYCWIANFVQFSEMYILIDFRSANYDRLSFVVMHISPTPKSLISTLVNFFQFQRYNTMIIDLKMNPMMSYDNYDLKKSTLVFGTSLKLINIVKIMKKLIFDMSKMIFSTIYNLLFSGWSQLQ